MWVEAFCGLARASLRACRKYQDQGWRTYSWASACLPAASTAVTVYRPGDGGHFENRFAPARPGRGEGQGAAGMVRLGQPEQRLAGAENAQAGGFAG